MWRGRGRASRLRWARQGPDAAHELRLRGSAVSLLESGAGLHRARLLLRARLLGLGLGLGVGCRLGG